MGGGKCGYGGHRLQMDSRTRMPSLRQALTSAAALAILAAGSAPTLAAPTPAPAAADPLQPQGWPLHWRLLGPLRGGWAEMSEGSAQRPDLFVMGAAGGGVWKTENAGRTWTSLFDKGPTAAMGAVAIAPSNPDVIYAGSGQPTPRYDVARGAGVFRTTDGGKTWSDLGLHETYAIGRILVDPKDPDRVLVAAVGHFFGPNPERGVFRSTDGGKTWHHTLKIDADTGAVDLTADPANPMTVFATSWQARQYPWQSYFTPISGPGSAIWRSDDGGETFHKLGGEGWPKGPLGRLSVAATRTATGALRLYAMVTPGEASGLYRSDDGGGHWMRVNAEDAFTGYYASHIAVAPNDPDTVYLVGQSVRRCDQGGAHCEIIRGSPGGDDYHFVWINPKDPSHWATASDQGAAITVDGGKTFSSWYNQPTGQFYHLATDNQFPYKVYSGQQDSGTVGLASRSDYGPPNLRDWRPVGAEERDYDIPDPEDPNIVYGTGLGGKLQRFDARTGEVADISPYLEPNYGRRQTTVAHHFVWVTPLAVSRTGPVTLYLGGESVFRSKDRGQTWQVISPDLGGRVTGDKAPAAKACDGDVSAAAARPCGYGGIWSMATSARHAGEVWVGTDSGLVQMTRDDGEHWTDVTPAGLPAWAKIASVDISDLEDGTAYVTADNQRQDDFSPRAFVTHDYGKTWRDIGSGLPKGGFAAVVRADTVKPGLLYAGTETGVSVSFDDGAHWSSLQKDLPTAWVRDLSVHGDDLVAATQGRAIWILDNVTLLRQLTPAVAATPQLFTPAEAWRLRPSNNRDTPLAPEEPVGENPPDGASLDYWLPRAAKSVSLEIRNEAGELVRVLSDMPGPKLPAEQYFSDLYIHPAPPLSRDAGLHRVQWDLRWPRPAALSYDFSIAASVDRDTPMTPAGAYALPGTYAVTLKVDGRTVATRPLRLKADPRLKSDPAALAASLALSKAIGAELATVRRVLGEGQAVATQLAALKSQDPALTANLQAAKGWVGALDALHGAAGMLAGVETDLEGADRGPTAPQSEAVARHAAAVEAAVRTWTAHLRDDLPRLNAALAKARLKPVHVPDGTTVALPLEGGGEDLP